MNSSERFDNILSSISREGADLEGIKECLKSHGFYLAPASSKYHKAYEGGLCEHSLLVYQVLSEMVYDYCPDKYSDDTIKIVALLHDVSKANYYVEEIKNRKVYSEKGSKSDGFGKFDWESYKAYSVKAPEERNLFGTPEENSYYIVSQYIPLTLEESAAILNHRGNAEGSSSSVNKDLPTIFKKYPLVSLLHVADFLATYLPQEYLQVE